MKDVKHKIDSNYKSGYIPRPNSPWQPKQFEYRKTIEGVDLNDMGSQGWQLSVIDYKSHDDPYDSNKKVNVYIWIRERIVENKKDVLE